MIRTESEHYAGTGLHVTNVINCKPKQSDFIEVLHGLYAANFQVSLRKMPPIREGGVVKIVRNIKRYAIDSMPRRLFMIYLMFIGAQ
jgi:hypothetical protein